MDIKATKKIQETVELIRAMKAKQELLKKNLAEAIETVTAFMGDSETLISVDGSAIIGTYKERGGNPTFDKDAFRTDHPKLFDKYQKPGTAYKVFLPK